MKRYCSHCGTPNLPASQICSKCNKPLNSGLKTQLIGNDEEKVVIVKKKPVRAKRIRYVDEDGNDLSEETQNFETPQLSLNDVVIEKPQKLTIASLKNGARVNVGSRMDALPEGVEVSSKSYFHQENLE